MAKSFRFTAPQVEKIAAAGREAQKFTDKARNILQAAVDVASGPATGSGQLNALADILDGFAQGFRRLADLAHAQEFKATKKAPPAAARDARQNAAEDSFRSPGSR